MARGGYQSPKRPAAVSGPSRMSRRTDGGPGSDSQPIRVPTGGDYGSATQSRTAQQAVPLRAVPTPTAPASPPVAGPPPPAGVFGPTQRPMESPLAGMPSASPQAPPMNVDDALRALYSVFPHPQLLRLIQR